MSHRKPGCNEVRADRATRFEAGARIPCPFLPPFRPGLDYRHLQAHRGREDADLVPAALEYAQALWMADLPARAILALGRALYAAPPYGKNSVHPLPYAALFWICRTHGGTRAGFLGNPRISFQHQAQRMRKEPVERRRARAWAAWFLAAQALPEFPDDGLAKSEQPSRLEVVAALRTWTSPAEADLWEGIVV